MKKLLLSLLFVPIWPALSQMNPKIDKLMAAQDSPNPTETVHTLRLGEKRYRQGEGARQEALVHYLSIHPYNQNSGALNYKIGVCYLQSTRPDKALEYLKKCPPNVTKDYYYQLGLAYMHTLDYPSASDAFDKHLSTLGKCKAKTFRQQYDQLLANCVFGATAVADSLPYFVIRLGGDVNSQYHDYSPILVPSADTALYFTSRRPIDEPRKFKSYDKYPERILKAEKQNDSTFTDPAEPWVFQTSRHTSVSGYYDKDKKIFYYLGKHQFGNISSARLVNGSYKKASPLRGKVNKMASKETSFTQDTLGNAYFISDKPGGYGGKDIYECKQTGKNRYKKVKNIGNQINTPFDEEGVQVTPDGKYLFFSSKGHAGMGGFDVYVCEKLENGRWSQPVNLGYPINSPADELFYRPSADLLQAYVSTTRKDAVGGLDIYLMKKDTRIPFELTGTVTHDQTGNPLRGTVTAFETETQKVLASAPTDSLAGRYRLNFEDKGSYQILVDVVGYKSAQALVPAPEKRHDRLTMDFALEKLKYPITLSGIITNQQTLGPVAARIGFKGADSDSILHLAFSDASTGHYSITFADKANFVMEMEADGYMPGKEVLLLKNNPSDKAVLDVALTPLANTYTLKGKVLDVETKQPIRAMVNIFSANADTNLVAVKTDSINGNYQLILGGEGPYAAVISAEGYFFANQTIAFAKDSLTLSKDFELQKMKQGVKIVIENILFDTGKSTLLPQSFKELDKLAALLLENPTVRIEVSGHTDNVGSAAGNKKLSKARALSVKNYLFGKGVPEKNLEYEGYGSEQPVADNKTAKGKAQNRRVEIKVLEQ
ncbi:MAG: OmpA family protein [Breznakibacter sp.]